MIKYSKDKYGFDIRGVIHIGAHHGQENVIYEELKIQNRIFFEPIKSNFDVLRKNISDDHILVNKALGNSNKQVKMFRENNNQGQSSSILKPKVIKNQYPWIKFESEEVVEMIKLDDVEFDRKKFNFINIDVQGYELEVFKGAQKTLDSVDYIISEINREELYENCTQIEELEEFLSKYNFKLVETNWGGGTWGDAIFIKNKDEKNNMETFEFKTFFEPYRDLIWKTGKSRYFFYEYIIKKLVSYDRPIFIVETGTMYSDLENNTGAFTLIFADLIKNWTGGKLITIDISEKHIEACKKITEKFSDVIQYVVSDSVAFLREMNDNEVNQIDLLYLDSWDFYAPDPVPSQLHHFLELNSVYDRLPSHVCIAVDDNLLPNHWLEWITYASDGSIINKERYEAGPHRIFGKGTLVDCYLMMNGWKRKDDFLNCDSYHLLSYQKI